MSKPTKLFARPSGVVCAVLLVTACGGSDGTIAMVRGGTLQACPNATVEQMVESFMGNPSWEAGAGEDNVKFVNVSGDITYADKPVRAVVQFVINEKNNSFQYQAFEINEVPQDNLTATALLEKMCESTEQHQSAQTAATEAASAAPSATYSRQELTDSLTGKNKQEVMNILGKPSDSSGSEALLVWTYEGISYDPDTGSVDDLAQVHFMDGAVFQVFFM